MTVLKVIMDMEGKAGECHPGVPPADIQMGEINAIGCLPNGMSSGKTSVGISGTLKDGTPVYMELSLKMFQMAAAAFHGRFGDETDGGTIIAME